MPANELPEEFVTGFVDLCDVEVESLKELHSRICKQSEVLFPEELRELAKSAFSSVELSDQFIQQLLSASQYFHERNRDIEIEDVETILAKKIGELDQAIDPKKIKFLLEIFLSETAFLTRKLFELAYRHPDMVRDTNIIVDARPIFDRKHSRILTYVLLTHLKLDLHRHNEPELLSLYLDRNDIKKLRDVCDTALVKLDETAKQLVGATGAAAYMPGAENKEEQ